MNQIMKRTPIQFLLFLGCLYLFFVSIELMSSAFEIWKGFSESLIATTKNPIVGLFIGIVATSLVQSSSSTTSILVGLVAAGQIEIPEAIPIVMGANIGTTVTNIIVSMGLIRRRQEFSRALAGATVHDFFNLLSVLIFLPLEMTTHFIERTARFLAATFENTGGFTLISPLKAIVSPVAGAIGNVLRQIISSPDWASAILILVCALAMLFLALKYMVTLMKKFIFGKIENLLHQYLFKSPFRSFFLGLILTAIIQSSSATTSLIIPIVGAGILTVHQIFPYVLGTNIGTTVTAILASLVTNSPAAITVAFAHLTFNVAGTVCFYPLKIIPITMASKFGSYMATHKLLAPLFLIIFFFVTPLIIIFMMKGGF